MYMYRERRERSGVGLFRNSNKGLKVDKREGGG
jgi:hypothetical protein